MKKVVLMIMIALMSGAVDAVANTTTATEQNDVNKRRRKKRKQKRGYSSHHAWKSVNIGRTCNKRR
jgi:hypothetical protein